MAKGLNMSINKAPIFFDNNATTPISEGVLNTFIDALKNIQGNPSSITKEGRYAKNQIHLARKSIASFLQCSPNEIFFTSGGTESIYTLIQGICSQKKGPILTTLIEHKCVLSAVDSLFLPVHYITTNYSCSPTISEIVEFAEKGVAAMVFSFVNGETGSILPLKEIAEIAHRYNIPLIIDAVASLGKIKIPLYEGITAMAFSGHKCHGPKGTGFIYLRKKTPFRPLFKGGMQENGYRAGTENVAGILGLAKSIEEIADEKALCMQKLRDSFEERIKKIFPKAQINGGDHRICNVSNIYFEGVDGDHLLIYLDQHGVCASLGSACSSGSLSPSHVLLGIGCSAQHARSSLRFSFSYKNTLEEVEKVCTLLEMYKGNEYSLS